MPGLSYMGAALVMTTAMVGARQCPNALLSCNSGQRSADTDPCCVPSPAGLFLFRQRFEADIGAEGGRWGVDGIDVLNCDESTATTAFSPTYTHEEIASFSLRSDFFDEDGFARAEEEWAQSEVGEGVEEVWERAWNSAGRFISTQAQHCQPDGGPGAPVAAFFHTLHLLHKQFPIQRILTDADITPAADTTYSLDLLQSTLSVEGHEPIIVCDNATLSTVLWPLHARGLFEDAHFEPAKTHRASNCPKDGIVYPPSTSLPRPTETATWDAIHRPSPRPITMSHDESRMYYRYEDDSAAAREDPKKLGIFKAGGEGREARGVDGAGKKYVRDEL